MKIEAIETPCRCQDKQCAGQRLTQLHLYARTDADVEMLQALSALFMENAEGPVESVDMVISLDELLPVFERVRIAAAKSSQEAGQ